MHGLRLISQRYTPFKIERLRQSYRSGIGSSSGRRRIDVESITGKARPGRVVK